MHDIFVDGVWQEAADGGQREVTDPLDGHVVRMVAEGTAADAELAIGAARRAFDTGPWPSTSPAERGRVLARVADLLADDRAAIAALETSDTGKTLTESRADVDDVVAVFRYFAELAPTIVDRDVPTGTASTRSVIVHEPVGVCGMITPWNYPLLQASWKLAPALAAGNTMVLKPSELTPLTSIRCVELIAEAGVPDGVVNLVPGAGSTVGAALARDPRVDLISFTGGVATGREVMRTAADTVKRIALELGGKNPNVVFADAAFDTAVDYAMYAVFLHAGQVCSAGARLLVHNDIHDRFVTALVDRVGRIRLGRGTDPDTEMGPMISAAHRDKVEAHVAAALADGARLATGGRRPEDPALADGWFYEPTVLVDVPDDAAILREEVFGPVLTVERFRDEEEAVRLANDTVYGLAAGVWTGDPERADRVARAIRAGTVWINDFHPYFPQAPWGGFKQSGIGRELGPEGLAEYHELKHLHTNLEPHPTGWFGTKELP